MRIIAIDLEFASGGRELGKRLADARAVYPMTIGQRFQFYLAHTKDSIQVLISQQNVI